ncbi:Holliday junction branch migration protein RuvA [Candidatus Saccharibacteria bacterium]|nr:Holliday junction branch migration protein RuvA [Candidatus Saccharibacteria bacterium]
MIARLAGMVVEKALDKVIIDVGGVGYEVYVPSHDYDALTLDEAATIYTHHVVREQAEELYGFSSLAAKQLFRLLISVNGVGPKAGISVMSLGPPEGIRNAIANADFAFIGQAAGVGKKTAERVVVDLRDKVGVASSAGLSFAVASDDALDALLALGLTLNDATAKLAEVDGGLPTEERIRLALQK